MPEVDSPETMGLHQNADLTYSLKEAKALFTRLSNTQPKGGGGASDGSPSREDVVYEKATELLSRLPQGYIEDEYRAQIRKLGGLTVPLNIFLFQEVQRFQAVIAKVRGTLQQLQLAIKGEVVMTPELSETLDSLYDARVPDLFENTLTGDEFSWRSPTLGLWFSSLLERNEQYRGWLSRGRPRSFWLTGFFNGGGLLTAMKQEVCRSRNKAGERVALDDMVYVSEVLPYEKPEQIKTVPEDGILITGLSLEGAAFDRRQGHLIESEPKELYTSLPVLHVTAMSKAKAAAKKRELGSLYQCPVYKYAQRGDNNLIFIADLATGDSSKNHWCLRGTALLCNT